MLRTGMMMLIGLCLLVATGASQESEKVSNSTGASSPRQQAPIAVGPGISPPRAIFAPDPDYPISARRGKHRVQGSCVLGLTVDEQGSVHDVHVTRSLDKRLDQSAIDAVKQWKFQPAMKNGKPVAVSTSVEVGFWLY